MPDSLGLDGTRSRELPCHPPFAQFIRAELIPWIKDLYPITSDPSRNIAAGFSYGGLAAAYLAFRHPDVFGNFISLSGSFYWKPKDDPEPGWLISQFAEQPLRDLKYFIAAGLLETFKPFGGPSVLEAGRKMVSVLKAKGYQGRFIEFNGGHNEVCWRGLIPDALHFLGGNRDAKT
jgi:enterochelin esterase family protein